MTTINSNISALAAQNALRSANETTTTLVQRLSTGNRIVNASDDAAGLAIGTILSGTVSTLNAAFNSATQAKSLTAIADGGLAKIGDILQRLKSLAVQANSGVNGPTERGYLNQEFQSLKTQLDQIATNTKFNNTKLLDGSISGAVEQLSDTSAGGAVNTAVTAFTVAATLPTDGQTIFVNGAAITFTTDATRHDRVFVGADQTATAANLSAFLNQSGDSRISPFSFTSTGAAVSAAFAGGTVRTGGTFNISTADGTYTLGTEVSTITIGANGTDGLSAGRTQVNGTVQDTVLVALDRAITSGANGNGGVSALGVRGNPDFTGRIQGFNATYTGADAVTVSIRVGSAVYTAAIADTTPAADTVVTFTGVHDNGTTNVGTFAITLRDASGSAVTTQADANDYAERLNRAFSGLTFSQNRDVDSYVGGGDILTNGVTTGSLLNSRVDLRSSDFSKFDVSDIRINAPSSGNPDATIELVINGSVFKSSSGLGSTIAADGYVVFTNLDNPSEFIGFHNGDTAIQITNDAQALSFENALKSAFGLVDGAGQGLTFQVGVTASETIDVKIKSVTIDSLGLSDAEIVNDPVGASTAIDAAIDLVTSARSDVGAYQSRFGFVTATLGTAIQNTDAARAVLLDADVAKESTAFASAQVKILAGIAVLAQANQLPQNLLKLIG